MKYNSGDTPMIVLCVVKYAFLLNKKKSTNKIKFYMGYWDEITVPFLYYVVNKCYNTLIYASIIF